MTDNQIIDLFWNRNEDAIAATDAAYGRKLRGLSLRILQNQEDAEEVLNDTYSVSLISDLSDISDPPHDSCIWEELTVGGQPAKMMTTSSGQRLLFWKNEEEGFNAMLSVEAEAVDIVTMAESVAPGAPLEVSANHLGPDYTIELEQESSAYAVPDLSAIPADPAF